MCSAIATSDKSVSQPNSFEDMVICDSEAEAAGWKVGSAETATAGPTCTDSDGGFEPYVYGVVNSSFNEQAADICTGVNNKLGEATCGSNGIPLYQSVTCPNGCKDGACISA